MSDMFNYKDYDGMIEYSLEDKCFFGRIAFIRDLVSYEGQTIEELETAFHESVDDYLALCEREGKQPNKPFKGSFNVRTGPELHRRAGIYAQQNSINLNTLVREALESYIDNR